MKLRRALVFVALFAMLAVPLVARIVFTDIIPINAIIGLQETFSLEIKQQTPILFNEDLEGREIVIATYEFFSNNPDVAYQLRILPAHTVGPANNQFLFKFIGDAGPDPKKKDSVIPFKLSVVGIDTDATAVRWENNRAEKPIGVVDGNRSRENGSIVITFPTKDEGFNFKELASGAYQANILVEVSTD